jgi:hypothetical protein
LRSILWTDYPAFFAWLLPLILWIVYAAWAPDWRGDGPVMPAFWTPAYPIVAGALTVVCLGVLAARIIMITTLFKKGAIVPGRIASAVFRRDRGRVQVSFTFHGKPFQLDASLHRTRETLKLKEGQRVVLLVDEKRPQRAIIRDIYIWTQN